MNANTRTLLIIGGVAVLAWLVYQKATGPSQTRVNKSPIGGATGGAGQTISGATGQGSGGETSFWNSLGALGQGLNTATSSVESLYNQANNDLGLNSTNTGQGNNGTAG